MAGYVVTVKRECPACDGDGGTLKWRKGKVQGSDPCAACTGSGSVEVERHPVDTLEEARGVAEDAISRFPEETTERAEARSLPATGGTIGPLPDGTVITVEPAEDGGASC